MKIHFDGRKHPFYAIRDALGCSLTCTRLPNNAALPKVNEARVFYSLSRDTIILRNEVAAQDLVSDKYFTLPLLGPSLPPQFADYDASIIDQAEVCMCVEALEHLAQPEHHQDAAVRASALLTHCGDRILLLLELAAICIVTMPHDTVAGLHAAAVERAIRAYSTLVSGFYSCQLTQEAHVLALIDQWKLPLQCKPVFYKPERGARLQKPSLPRHRILDNRLHTAHGDIAKCQCAAQTPLYIETLGKAEARALLVSLRSALDYEDLDVCGSMAPLRCALIPLGDQHSVFVVWSLVFELFNERRHGPLVDAWHAQILLDSGGLIVPQPRRALDRVLADFGPGGDSEALHSYATNFAEAKSDDQPAPQLQWPDKMERPTSAIVGSGGAPFCYAQFPTWMRDVAFKRLVDLRKLKETTLHLAEARLLVRKHMQVQLFTSMQQIAARSVVKPVRDTHEIWRSAEYRRIEEDMAKSPARCELFFRDLMAGSRIRASQMRLLADGHLSFCIGGRFALCWKEFGQKYGPDKKGRGLGTLIMHCRGTNNALDAFAYIKAWTQTPHRAVDPRQSVVRLETEQRAAQREQAAKLLQRCTPVTPQTKANAYLRTVRGLCDAPIALIEENAALRAATLYYTADGKKWHDTPGLVAVVDGGIGAQRIFLDRTSARKRTDLESKMTIGTLTDDAGAAPGVCLQRGAPDAELCFVAEGPETALSVAMAWPDAAVYSILGIGSLARFKIRNQAQTLVLCRENDAEGVSQNVAKTIQDAIKTLSGKVRKIVSVWPPSGFGDFNDIHQAHPGRQGTLLIRKTIEEGMQKFRGSLKRSIPLDDEEVVIVKRQSQTSEN